tara:strand:- start:312 stop:623 length:312 start_codon:yes stop_codon:yes gene_type:complete
MIVKRNKMNEYLIKQFLNDKFPGYSAEHNGEWYFSLENDEFYGGKILKLKNNMGHTIIHLDNDNVTECANAIQDTLINLESILEQEKSINEYCSNNPWTYSGT